MASIYVDSNSVFYDTYRMYREYLGYTHEYTYKQWLRLDDKFKAAALYIQFYNEITLAWYKVKTEWSIEEEGVECVNQYLIKNVDKIKQDKKRFTPQYIYKVAWNCLYCVCIDPSKNKDRYYNETPSTFTCGDDELDWFDAIGQYIDFDEDREHRSFESFIMSLDEELQIYIDYLFNTFTETQTCKKLKKLKLIDGNILDSEYRVSVLSEFDKRNSERLKVELSLYLQQ